MLKERLMLKMIEPDSFGSRFSGERIWSRIKCWEFSYFRKKCLSNKNGNRSATFYVWFEIMKNIGIVKKLGNLKNHDIIIEEK